jgi:hypothetical protein
MGQASRAIPRGIGKIDGQVNSSQEILTTDLTK